MSSFNSSNCYTLNSFKRVREEGPVFSTGSLQAFKYSEQGKTNNTFATKEYQASAQHQVSSRPVLRDSALPLNEHTGPLAKSAEVYIDTKCTRQY